VPYHQIFLVATENLLEFLLKLRTVEFMTGIRVMPGQTFTDVNNTQCVARRGIHGLNILIHVFSGCPNHCMRALLRQFRAFHGPLHEATFVGFEDAAFVRGIEHSITAPRPANYTSFHEMLILQLLLTERTRTYLRHGDLEAATQFYHQAENMHEHHRMYDITPWTGWPRSVVPYQHDFAFVMMAFPTVIHQLISAAHNQTLLFNTLTEVYASHHPQSFLRVPSTIDVHSDTKDLLYLTTGLVCILSARMRDPTTTPNFRLGIISHGVRNIAHRLPVQYLAKSPSPFAQTTILWDPCKSRVSLLLSTNHRVSRCTSERES
jgi:hypothetical protein